MSKNVKMIFLVLVFFNFIFVNKIENSSVLEDKNNDSNDYFAVYVENELGDYEASSIIPEKNSGYEFKEAICNGDAILTFNEYEWAAYISNMNENRTKCKLYFNIIADTAREYILGQNNISDGLTSFSSNATTNEGLLKGTDDDGDTYYYRGAVTNNYVKFAGFYWRIIRINGDATIRLIYQGTSATSTGSAAQIGSSSFNAVRTDNMYVGFMYESGNVHGYVTSSTIKNVLDAWYKNNLLNYADYIDTNAGFCGDRTPSTILGSSDGIGGTGTTVTYYSGAIRTLTSSGSWNNTQTPSYNCNSSDLYTLNGSSNGNKALNYPIGLITADELIYAGVLAGQANTNFYLYTGSGYWTMTPFWYKSNTYAHVFSIYTDGTLGDHYANTSFGVRPVINIKKNVIVTGSGISTDPYVFS